VVWSFLFLYGTIYVYVVIYACYHTIVVRDGEIIIKALRVCLATERPDLSFVWRSLIPPFSSIPRNYSFILVVTITILSTRSISHNTL
jgi:hypothetical protein